jgi:hypothetical protein
LLYAGVKFGLSDLGKKVKLKLFEIRVLRKMYGPKTEEVTADRIQQHNEQFHDLHIFVCLSAAQQLNSGTDRLIIEVSRSNAGHTR